MPRKTRMYLPGIPAHVAQKDYRGRRRLSSPHATARGLFDRPYTGLAVVLLVVVVVLWYPYDAIFDGCIHVEGCAGIHYEPVVDRGNGPSCPCLPLYFTHHDAPKTRGNLCC